MFLEILQNLHENTCARVSFLIKLLVGEACNVIKKEILAQVFSFEFWEISKNTFCYRAPQVAASAYCRRKVVKIEKLKAFIIKYYDILNITNLSLSITIWKNCVKDKKMLN